METANALFLSVASVEEVFAQLESVGAADLPIAPECGPPQRVVWRSIKGTLPGIPCVLSRVLT